MENPATDRQIHGSDPIRQGMLVSSDVKPVTSGVSQSVTAAASSIGQALSEASNDITAQVRGELERMKTEVKAEAATAGKGAGALGIAALAGHLAVFSLTLAAIGGFMAVMPLGWASLIVAIIWAVVAGVAYAYGRRRLKKASKHIAQQIAEGAREAHSAVR